MSGNGHVHCCQNIWDIGMEAYHMTSFGAPDRLNKGGSPVTWGRIEVIDYNAKKLSMTSLFQPVGGFIYNLDLTQTQRAGLKNLKNPAQPAGLTSLLSTSDFSDIVTLLRLLSYPTHWLIYWPS
ncbi:uncharacterized protein ATNIH1004_011836 [Aspergillus tanneri]|uniref:Uncharacterized protein n=1 Tax=Aspergillus tanneri TaxID=1220188 RepID=A0A5M9M871_9EURO|nr:uncharacterized protein ATNIH1004_011836 [Aspergillus tanneri]KAA8641700.1 hypothetical protein ATNIH1004_011836 [Aspergillus tanneri]